MIHEVAEIGKLAVEGCHDSVKSVPWVVISILLEGEKFAYSGIVDEEFKSSNADKYLYKRGASMGNVACPFCSITETEKTFHKVARLLEQCQRIESCQFADPEREFLENVFKSINDNKNVIIEDIKQKLTILDKDTKRFASKIKNIIAELNKREKDPTAKNIWNQVVKDYQFAKQEQKCLKDVFQVKNGAQEITIESLKKRLESLANTRRFLTVKINGKYLGEYSEYRKCLNCLTEAERKKSASMGTCSICKTQNVEVYGNVGVFKFYTIDKQGFIASGFEEALAWKNYPLCSNCVALLEKGKELMQNKLKFTFAAGLNYYLIPRVLSGDMDKLKNALNTFLDTTKMASLKNTIKKRITADEKEILSYFSEVNDELVLNFLFLQKEQGAERILLMIKDVFPSRIRKIFEAKDYVDAIFKDKSANFTFKNLREFFLKFDKKKSTNDLDKVFLEIVDSVFKEKKLKFQFLIKFFMSTIRDEFKNDGFFHNRAHDALMSTVFLEYLNLITFREVQEVDKTTFSTVFEIYGKSFGSPASRGIFLIGALTQLLLNKQWTERGSKPFMKKLKNLKMEQRDIKALLPEVQNKLEEYDNFDSGKKLIAKDISHYLLKAGDDWKLSIDEINYYFACGMNLANDVASIAYKNENNKAKEVVQIWQK